MKKLLIISISCLSVFLIYLSTIDRKVYVTILTTNENSNYSKNVEKFLKNKNMLEKYVNDFSFPDYRITDYIKIIMDNKMVKNNGKKLNIKNALIKSDLIIIDLVKNDLFSKIIYEEDDEVLHNYVESIADDLDKLLKLIRNYSKEDIYILEIYNPNNLFDDHIIKYMNNKIKHLSEHYKVKYIKLNINEAMIKEKIKINKYGEESIYKSIEKELNKSLFNK